ncbi:anthranilate synthase family protein [Actinopolyspora mortivallis]|uniref:anthranilate synthase family protein n=1 Tax=Actinopolyspora mortivallis TaxID=33906 RepID=UPI0003A3C30D|nr:anthranilate synthase family protein [Actinopolyspora mortivallis]
MSPVETTPSEGAELLDEILSCAPPPFALLHRPESTGSGRVELLLGTTSVVDTIADIPVPESSEGPAGADVLALLPYRQLSERGFPAPDDGTPLVTMRVERQTVLDRSELLGRVPDRPIDMENGHFDIDDATYAELVREVLADDIGSGAGANFVLKRSFVADIAEYTPETALAFFRRLLEHESGAYWTFLVYTGQRTLVGASPERHVSLHHGTAVMNPISGTYRYPSSGPTLSGVMDFLDDGKEMYELYMVVDEELKMMSQVCDHGTWVTGPFLKEMARLAHTEYFIKGRTERDVREILRTTLLAPTVTGSPLESASRVISRYEPHGRGYYSGVLALIGRDGQGGRTLDSSILIRTADIDADGRMTIGVGATLVRDSDPDSEIAETSAKATGLLTALRARPSGSLGEHPQVLRALRDRNDNIAGFWLRRAEPESCAHPTLHGKSVLIVDAEDTFTAMLGHQLRSLGLRVTVRRFDEPYSWTGHDLVVMGPGPGDPRDGADPKIALLRGELDRLLEEGVPFLAVCLSHQVLSDLLGLELAARDFPNQGVQKEIDFFGSPERVGFYNTFAARVPDLAEEFEHPHTGTVELSRDPVDGEVHGLRGRCFAGIQFHAESVLTQGGVRLLGQLLTGVLDTAPHPVRV